jgi:hypothetical protein
MANLPFEYPKKFNSLYYIMQKELKEDYAFNYFLNKKNPKKSSEIFLSQINYLDKFKSIFYSNSDINYTYNAAKRIVKTF